MMDKKSRELVMAKLYFKNKDYKMAETTFNQYLSMVPDDVSALKLLAQVYEQTKRFDKAFEMYERCYLAEPDRTGVLLDISRLLLMNDIWLDQVDYKKWLNLAIRAFPSNPIVVNLKAFLSTLPANDPPSSQPESQPKTSEDALTRILEKLSLIESRLDKIESNMSNVEKSRSPAAAQATPTPSPATIHTKFETREQANPENVISGSNNNDANTTTNLFSLSLQKLGSTASFPSFSFSSPIKPQENVDTSEKKSEPVLSGFHQSSFGTTTNLFAQSIQNSNPSAFPSFNFSLPKPQVNGDDAHNNENDNDNDNDNGVAPNEELPIEGTCDLPEINLRTGEEDEDVLFESRAKLYRLRDKEYKERGLGNIKVLKHRNTGKIRLIMRRDAIGLVCLNCIDCRSVKKVKENQITWIATDSSEEQPETSGFLVKFKLPETAEEFLSHLERAEICPDSTKSNLNQKIAFDLEKPPAVDPTSFNNIKIEDKTEKAPSESIFSSFNQSSTTNLFAQSIQNLNSPNFPSFNFSLPKPQVNGDDAHNNENDNDNDNDNGVAPNEELPIEGTCDLPEITLKTGEEDEDVLFESRAKLYRLSGQEYKERGVGNIKVLKHKNTGKIRLIMRRDAIGLVCLNCIDCRSVTMVKENQIRWAATDLSDEQPAMCVFLVRFKLPKTTEEFLSHLQCEEPEIELVDPKLDQDLVEKARKLQLPDLFYHKIKNQDSCSGCNGCEKDE